MEMWKMGRKIDVPQLHDQIQTLLALLFPSKCSWFFSSIYNRSKYGKTILYYLLKYAKNST